VDPVADVVVIVVAVTDRAAAETGPRLLRRHPLVQRRAGFAVARGGGDSGGSCGGGSGIHRHRTITDHHHGIVPAPILLALQLHSRHPVLLLLLHLLPIVLRPVGRVQVRSR
jgi:hypothetical protein